MKKITKDQQEFWDILRLPYKQTCDNCFYNSASIRKHVGCYALIGACDMNNFSKRTLKWKWDGETY